MLKSNRMPYTFTTDGDYVEFAHTSDSNYIRKIAKTAKCMEWSYDDSTPVTISFDIDNLSYRNIPIGDIIIDGETMTTTAGFETAIGTIFPNLAGGGSTVVTVYQRKTILTDAQIKALPTTPVELVPVQGVGKMPVIHGGMVVLKNASGGYTNVNVNAYMSVINVKSDGTVLSDAAFLWTAGVSVLLNASNKMFQFLPRARWDDAFPALQGTDVYSPIANYDNSSFYLFIDNAGGGNFTGGNAANTLEVTVFYSIVDL